MLNRVYEYVKDKEFRFTVYKNRVHIMNYKKIISLKNNYTSPKRGVLNLLISLKS